LDFHLGRSRASDPQPPCFGCGELNISSLGKHLNVPPAIEVRLSSPRGWRQSGHSNQPEQRKQRFTSTHLFVLSPSLLHAALEAAEKVYFVSGHDFTGCGKTHVLYQGTTLQLAEKRGGIGF
jgi:hypothetical protein